MPTDLPIQATAFLIVFARMGAALMLLPVFSEDSVPARIRLLLALGMSFGLYGLIGGPAQAFAGAITSDGALAGILLAELAIGLALGMIVRILFFAVSIAGSLISMQIGLSAAALFDPAQGGQVPLVSKLVTVAAALVCMAMQVHHLWLGAIVRSYALFPIGGILPTQDFAQLAIVAVGKSMALGISLAAPLLVFGIVFNVMLGMMARVAPAIQIFFVAQPLNLLLGIALTAATIGAVLTRFAETMADWMQGSWS